MNDIEAAVCSTLTWMFVSDADDLSEPQKRLIGALKMAIKTGKVRERMAATMTLLKLCECKIHSANDGLSSSLDSCDHTHISP